MVETREMRTVADLIEYCELDPGDLVLCLNGTPARRSGLLAPGDVVTLEREAAAVSPAAQPVLQEPQADRLYRLVVNGTPWRSKPTGSWCSWTSSTTTASTGPWPRAS